MITKSKKYLKGLYNAYRIKRLLKLDEQGNFIKLTKMFKKTQDYQVLKVDQFPFLYYLISQQKVDAVNKFIQTINFRQHVLLNDQNPLKCNPIIYAAMQGKLNIVEILQSYGANITIPNSQHQNLLHLAAIYRRNEAFQLGIRKGVDINLQDKYGNTPFHYACRTGILQMITAMIIGKAKKLQNATHQFPIHMAIESAEMNAYQLLQGDINANDYQNYHPIHSAVRSSNQQIFKAIIKKNLSFINRKDFNGLTPLHHAVIIDNYSMVQLILKHKQVLVNEPDIYKNTPLHLAMMGNNIEIIRYLIDNKANLDYANQDHMTAAEYGLSNELPQIVNYVKGLGSKSKKVSEWSSIKY